jgi:hypothetical protein
MQEKALSCPKYICIKVYPCLAGTGAIKMQMWVLRMLMLEVENNTEMETDFLGPGRRPWGRMWEPVGAGMKRGRKQWEPDWRCENSRSQGRLKDSQAGVEKGRGERTGLTT